jgi:hypothetical protein
MIKKYNENKYKTITTLYYIYNNRIYIVLAYIIIQHSSS